MNVGKPTLVGSYPAGASPYGVLDMAGNVWEWCATDYHTGSNHIDKDAGYRILRGGSWSSHASHVRAARRDGLAPDVGSPLVGLRVVRVVDGLEAEEE